LIPDPQKRSLDDLADAYPQSNIIQLLKGAVRGELDVVLRSHLTEHPNLSLKGTVKDDISMYPIDVMNAFKVGKQKQTKKQLFLEFCFVVVII
jgi:hypothetical protein